MDRPPDHPEPAVISDTEPITIVLLVLAVAALAATTGFATTALAFITRILR